MRQVVCGAAVLLFSTAVALHAADNKKNPDKIGDRNVAAGLNRYSVEQELALGRQLAAEVEKQAKIVADPIVAEYINRLGQNLARNSDSVFPMSFRLLESDEINAFTLPGGYVFISTGLLKLSDNEAELASVMAHELAHAAARHATRQATRSDLISAGKLPLLLTGGLAGIAARQAVAPASAMVFYHFSREYETEADLLGLEYLWKAGYDPGASVDMFERLESTEKTKPGSVSQLFRTHPQTAARMERTQKNIESLLPSRAEHVLSTSEYESIRERLLPASSK